jgi:hypothetical protein
MATTALSSRYQRFVILDATLQSSIRVSRWLLRPLSRSNPFNQLSEHHVGCVT